MSTITHNAITSNAVQNRFGANWSSVYDMLKPQVWQELVQLYGQGIGLAEFAHIQGATVNVAGATKTVYEEGSIYKLIEVEAVAPVADGEPILVTVADAEYLNGYCYLTEGDVIVVPPQYLEKPTGTRALKPELYQVISIANRNTVAAVYTCEPQLSTVALHVAIPNGTKLMVTGGNWANEAAGARPKASGWSHRSFTCSTVRTPWSIGGSQQSNQRYYEELRGGGTGIFTKTTAEADMRHTKTISDQMFIGSGISNTAIAMPNRYAENILATGTVGVLQHLVDRAMPQYYTAAYDKPCFEDLKAALQSQGVLSRNVTFFFGSELGRQIENLNLDFIKEFSGGSDFMKTLAEINVAFKAVNYNGVYTTFKELNALSDPTAYGAAAFDDYFTSMGFIIPDTEVTLRNSMESAPFTLKNLTLGYKAYNGEDRTRVVKLLPGVASIGDGNSGLAVDTFDDSRGEILSEFMVIFNKTNQCILVQDDRILIEV
jgi:hypothetical protein